MIEAEKELDFHCPDTVRSMIQDGCRHLQRILKQRAAEARKKKLEHQQIMNGRNKRENNDSMDHLNATQNDANVNYIDNDDDGDDSTNFTVQFLENECKCQFKFERRLFSG